MNLAFKKVLDFLKGIAVSLVAVSYSIVFVVPKSFQLCDEIFSGRSGFGWNSVVVLFCFGGTGG